MIEVKTDVIEDPEYLKNSTIIFERIIKLLEDSNIQYELTRHQPMGASKEVARVLNEKLEEGGKAMVMKINGEFKLFVLSAAKRISLKKIQTKYQTKKIQFANGEELKKVTGLVPGCVPPFGEPILPIELLLDDSIYDSEYISFNAGSLTATIRIKVSDYLNIVKGERFDFSEPLVN